MIPYELPVSVTVSGKNVKIRNGCDYRVVLDCFDALKDEDMSASSRVWCALRIFYEDFEAIKNDMESAAHKMLEVLNCGRKEEPERQQKAPLMDWSHDFQIISSAVSRVLGYDVRDPGRVTHWWTFVSAYMEIGECVFSTIVSLRKKRNEGKKLEKWEREYIAQNRELIEIPNKNLEKNIQFLLDFE